MRKQDKILHFNTHYDVSERGCWDWTGSMDNKGYGVIYLKRKAIRAHRFSYEMHKGPCGDLFVLHQCDNPRCVNPAHLHLGTHEDNMQDMARKHRSAGAKMDECRRGHSLHGENIRMRLRGGKLSRTCRACDRMRHSEKALRDGQANGPHQGKVQSTSQPTRATP